MPRVLLQRFRDGQLELVEIPTPRVHPNGLLIETAATVVSPGTERMLLDFGRSSAISKVRKQPDRVAEVMRKATTDGVGATISAVQSKLDEPTPLGYANAGVVREVGSRVTGFRPGQLVATNGPHAEWISVPATLAAKVPNGVPPSHAAFTTLGSVALQGLRLCRPELGETFAVVGLGVIGLLAVQLLQTNGCRVLAIDPSHNRQDLASRYGATVASPGAEAQHTAEMLTEGRGLDGVLICASTSSDAPIHEAAQMCRQRGRLVLVGVTGLTLERNDFYAKELTFQVSASFGPGKYDPSYEELGTDYPFGHVRWTAGRNMTAIAEALATGAIGVGDLITHRFQFENASRAYDLVLDNRDALGIVLEYTAPSEQTDGRLGVVRSQATRHATTTSTRRPADGRIAVVGAGNYATRTLLPALTAAGADLSLILSSGGTSAAIAARRFGVPRAGTDVEALWEDDEIDTVVIATRHDSHARLAAQALAAGKNVFVEKPLAINLDELDLVEQAWAEAQAQAQPPLLMVGYNRRFAPTVEWMQSRLKSVAGPAALHITMNAGAVPPTHWTHDPAVGGGRILGEGCHLLDLARFFAGAPIVTLRADSLNLPTRDSALLQISFANSSVATVSYLSNGSGLYPKERLEIYRGGTVLVNDNYRRARRYDDHVRLPTPPAKQRKGHLEMAQAFLSAVRRGASPPIPTDQLFEVSRWSIRAQAAIA